MTTQNQPLVSVIMPVHNAGAFLYEAIESIRSQTYTNWELIAVDDASADNSYAILREFARKDSRIKVFKNKKRLNVSGTAAFALSKSKGSLIARMDADDISRADRFEKQVKYLLKNKDVVAVGAQCNLIDKEGNIIGKKSFPTDYADVRKMIFWSIPLQQPSVMINKAKLPKNFIWYDKRFNVAEEVELIFKLFQYGKVCNLPQRLLQYRIHDTNVSLQHPKKTFFLTLETRIKALWKYNYRPTIGGLAVTFAQTGLVILLPEEWIFPIYSFMRGLRDRKPIISRLQFEKVRI